MRHLDLSVYVITDRPVGRGRHHEEMAAAAIAGGATVLQLREKTATTRQFLEMAQRTLTITRRAGVPLIINDRVDIAQAIDADGVHVGPEDLPVAVARHLLGPNRIVGASAGTEAEARAAEKDGADYLGVGSVFGTSSKPDAGSPIGVEALRRIAQAVRIPIVAIGGITHTNAPEAIRAGAAGVAVISAIVAEQNIQEATSRLVDVISAARR